MRFAADINKRKMGKEWQQPSLTTVLWAVFGAFCFFSLGRLSVTHTVTPQEPHLRTISRTFTYERLFGSPPSPKVDYKWLHLFPSYGGFFKHPTVAPERSTFSVFHQLHCVNSIRRGYWLVHEAATSEGVFNESAVDMDASPPHIRHCIDLLRQAIMCRPDLTVEKKSAETGGVKGFGVEHQCHDWDQLVHWVKLWENEGVDGNHGHSHGHRHDM